MSRKALAVGEGYVLDSYGLGGRSDRSDYWALRERLKTEGRAYLWDQHDFLICGRSRRDEIRTDLGWIQVCGT